MSDITEQLLELKSEVEEAQQQANKAQGAHEQVLKQIKADFGCKNLQQARKKHKALKAQEAEDKQAFETEMETFQEKWGDRLDPEDGFE